MPAINEDIIKQRHEAEKKRREEHNRYVLRSHGIKPCQPTQKRPASQGDDNKPAA